MSVVINRYTYKNVLDVSYDHVSKSTLPKWINELEAINTKVWNRNIQRISYVLRVSDIEKWKLDQLLKQHRTVTIRDIPSEHYFMVWIISMGVELESKVNAKYPWKVTIEVISVAETSNYIGFEWIDASNMFEDGFQRIYFN